MESNILKRAKSIVKARRIDAIERLEKETEKAKANAEFCGLEQQIKLSTYNISKAIGKGDDITELEKKHAELLAKFNNVKLKIGLADNYYTCAICQDQGILDDGRFCKCLKQVYYDLIREESGIEKLPQNTFKTNKIQNIECKQKENLIRLYKSMEKYCANFPKNELKNIILMGEIGTGKSFIMSAVANEILSKGYTVQYLTAYAMSNLFDMYFFSDMKNKDEFIMDSMINADLLIIDDLGTEAIKKNITLEYLLHILDERVNKHTIITTNLSKIELKSRYGERISSRLMNKDTSKVCVLNGDDLRILKQK